MKILDDLKSLLLKGNALGLAVAVVFGQAVWGLASTVHSSIVSPLLDMITGGGEGIAKLNVKYLRFGSLIEGIVQFAVVIAVMYAVFLILLPMLGIGSRDEKPAPPPPTPPAPPAF